MNSILKIFIVTLFVNVSFNSFSQNKIEESKEELKKENEDHNANPNFSTDDNSSDNIFVDIITKIFLYTTYYSFIGNYRIEDHLHNNLTRYPYYDNLSGNYENFNLEGQPIKKVRFDLEDKLLLNFSKLYGNHLKIKIRTKTFFNFQTDYYQLFEYNKNEGNYSDLSLFSFNFCYDRIRFENFNLGWTLGANYIGSNVNKAGISLGFNTDVFISKPLSFYGSLRWGFINNARVNEYEIQCKYHRKNYFYTIGFEHLRIGTPTYNFISLGGGIYF
jgi:hypothetical protein